MESIEPTKAVCGTLRVAVTEDDTSHHTSAILAPDNSTGDKRSEADNDNAAISGIASAKPRH
jgi:hypothetical protein